MGHTPGPWIYDKGREEIYGPKSTGEVVVVYQGGLQFRSDAPLIAAAPDLLKELERLVTAVEDGCFCSEMEMATRIDEARAAIAKAKGET